MSSYFHIEPSLLIPPSILLFKILKANRFCRFVYDNITF